MYKRQFSLPEAFDIDENPETLRKRWQMWTTNLKWFLAASGITNEAQKRSILLFKAGDEISKIYSKIHHVNSHTLDDLIEEMSNYFSGQKNVVLSRFQFRCCHQEDQETVDAWYKRLCKLADTCEFEDLRNSLIRDQIVAACKDESLRQKLLKFSNIGLMDTLEIARIHEAETQQQEMINAEDSEWKSNEGLSCVEL